MKISSTKKISMFNPSRPWCIAQKTTKTHLRKIKREAGGMFCRDSYSLNKFRIIRSLESLNHLCKYLWVGRDLGNWWKEPWLVFLGHIVSSNKAWVVQVSLILGL
jgi:hypothetical protein